MRSLVQEKNTVLQEKGNLEREVKQLRGTTGRLTKVACLLLSCKLFALFKLGLHYAQKVTVFP